MEGQNLNFTGVQSYRKFNYDIMKLACTYSYQGKFLEKISGRRAIRNLITVTSSQPHAVSTSMALFLSPAKTEL